MPKKALRGKPAKWPNLEQRLKTWIMEQRQSGLCVSTKLIQYKARMFASKMKIVDFTGKAKWCFNFMRREGLAMRARTKLAQKMPPVYEDKIQQFHSYVIQLQKKYDFEPSQIANMDEVPLNFDVPSNRTVDVKGIKTVAIKTSGHEKTHYTAVLSCCADGTKLPPMLIFKRKTYPKETIPPGIIVQVHSSIPSHEDIMAIWFAKVIVKSFKKCGISNAMDGTEDDLIYIDSDSVDSSDAIEVEETDMFETNSDEEEAMMQ
ncbi:hypothetical protein KIL84_019780 [Mauremys mutica]|uniref:HTH CENPB-type domain-containing protein n=1 Tax=Mauremys mutica TaxID=74926 RepID=A0A9D3XVI7_9SAUR|nr:hypothetical protein KIL84_019780 [Mauremys mutica]